MQNTTLTRAAQILNSHPANLRNTANRFDVVEYDGKHRVIPNDILAFFRRTKIASGYLVPHWIRTRDDLLAAAAQIPPSEILELAHASTNKKVSLPQAISTSMSGQGHD